MMDQLEGIQLYPSPVVESLSPKRKNVTNKKLRLHPKSPKPESTSLMLLNFNPGRKPFNCTLVGDAVKFRSGSLRLHLRLFG